MKKQILLIEDDLSIATLQRDYLEINHFDATIATDGQQGLALALNEPFDLILLDLMLPTMDGFEICKEIRKKKDIPILIVSAKREDFDKIRGLGLGADDYITKPFSPNELVARVKAHIERYQRLKGNDATETAIAFQGIQIDKLAHKVHILEKEVIFTTREFELLVFLIEHPNRVWTKEDLFELVWKMDAYETELSTVVVHIKKIREKIHQAGDTTTYIETLWGSGYRFNR